MWHLTYLKCCWVLYRPGEQTLGPVSGGLCVLQRSTESRNNASPPQMLSEEESRAGSALCCSILGDLTRTHAKAPSCLVKQNAEQALHFAALSSGNWLAPTRKHPAVWWSRTQSRPCNGLPYPQEPDMYQRERTQLWALKICVQWNLGINGGVRFDSFVI
jgi:hypothetical protein